MTPQEAREGATVMLAFADGKEIECKHRKTRNQWAATPDPSWRLDEFEYRVAPEPWTGKIWVHSDGRVFSHHCTDSRMMEADGWKLITVKEVGDE